MSGLPVDWDALRWEKCGVCELDAVQHGVCANCGARAAADWPHGEGTEAEPDPNTCPDCGAEWAWDGDTEQSRRCPSCRPGGE